MPLAVDKREFQQRCLVLLAYLVCFAGIASALLQQSGFPLDDSYIHQTVARNLATYGIPGFIPGVWSSGSTSTIWPYIQALDFKLFPTPHPVLYNLAISFVLLSLIGQILFSLAKRDGFSVPVILIFSISPAFCGNFLWLGMLGMEHLLFVFFSLAAIAAWFDTNEERQWRTAILAAVWGGLVTLARPEGIVFMPLLLLAAKFARRSWKQSLVAGCICSIFDSLFFFYNFATSHSFMPVTYQGRSWLWFNEGGQHSLYAYRGFFSTWLRRLPGFFDAHAQAVEHGITVNFVLVMGFSLVLAGLLIMGAYYLLRKRTICITFLFVWCAAHTGTYLVKFPTPGHGGRYQPLILLLAFPCIFSGVLYLLERIARSSSNWPVLTTAGILIVSGTISVSAWRMITVDGIFHINNAHGQIAQWMLTHLPRNAKIAAFDIGKVSYEWNGELFDLGGLADHSYLAYLKAGRTGDYLIDKKIQYVMLSPTNMQHALNLDKGNVLKRPPLAIFCTPEDIWQIGFSNTSHAARCQALYSVNLIAAGE